MPTNNASNVKTTWSDSGWTQDGVTVLKKDEPETEPTTTTKTKSGNPTPPGEVTNEKEK